MLTKVRVTPRLREVTSSTNVTRKRPYHFCILICTSVPDFTLITVRMMAYIADGKNARNTFSAIVAKTPVSSLSSHMCRFTTSFKVGIISCTAPKVVQLDIRTTKGTQSVKTPHIAAKPAQFHPAEFISSSARLAYIRSLGSGAVVMLKSATSRVHCSREASRCESSSVKVTKPVEEHTTGSPRATPSSSLACACATSCVSVCSRFSQCSNRRLSEEARSGRPASCQCCFAWSKSRRACFSAATWYVKRPV
mmetsp:Transcript_85336/g.204421  ORF Transcript_85336/g.204421 Transcript_85336/m.204421 type:complete len:251 (+) Transcript_85336:789-1541(+)